MLYYLRSHGSQGTIWLLTSVLYILIAQLHDGTQRLDPEVIWFESRAGQKSLYSFQTDQV